MIRIRGRLPLGALVTECPVRFVPGSDRRVLILSMRRVVNLVASCALYEFEDTIIDLTGADRAEPESLERIDLHRTVYKALRYATGSAALADRVAPRVRGLRLDREYELFLPVFNNAYELYALKAVPDWRRRCQYAACYISEMWPQFFPTYLVELLAEFDHIYLGVAAPVAEVARVTGRPCSYLPLGADALLFSPYPDPPSVTVDVCGIGRRSPVTHEALLAAAQRRGLFYYYDTVSSNDPGIVNARRQITFSVLSHAEHRFLYANLLKRSRYFLANRARANEGEVTRGTQEIAGRFFEGAVAGTVLIGEPPTTSEFDAHFGWREPIVRTPFDSPAIADLIAELDADPERVARIRRENARNGLLRHDWLYRLETILGDAGIPPTPAMTTRRNRLLSVCDTIPAAKPATVG